MSQKLWTAVDRYITELLVPSDPILDAVLLENAQGGLPPIDVSASQGKLLNLLVHIQHARNILEIGTLGGYSTPVWRSHAIARDLRHTLRAAVPHHQLEFALHDFKHAIDARLPECSQAP